jgi:peptide/nickel transport system substrate-binding protein
MSTQSRAFRPLTVTLLLALSGAALNPAYAQTSGGILRAGMQADPVGLDPHVTEATSTRNQLENVYDTLVAFDATGKIVPSLATRWTVSKDNLTWTFTLRSGVKFHNGRALVATHRGLRAGQKRDGSQQIQCGYYAQQAIFAASQ